jgi:hypothetical protein
MRPHLRTSLREIDPSRHTFLAELSNGRTKKTGDGDQESRARRVVPVPRGLGLGVTCPASYETISR